MLSSFVIRWKQASNNFSYLNVKVSVKTNLFCAMMTNLTFWSFALIVNFFFFFGFKHICTELSVGTWKGKVPFTLGFAFLRCVQSKCLGRRFLYKKLNKKKYLQLKENFEVTICLNFTSTIERYWVYMY